MKVLFRGESTQTSKMNQSPTAIDERQNKVSSHVGVGAEHLFRPLRNVPEVDLFNPWWEAILAAYEFGQVCRHEAHSLRASMPSALEAMARARKIEAAMLEFLLATWSDPFIKVLGSASDLAANAPYSEPARRLFRMVLEHSVPRGLCVGNGGASTGFMGFSSRCFHEVRAAIPLASPEVRPRLAVVPLLPQDPANWREPKFVPSGPGDLSSPPQMLFQTRTPLLFGFGQTLASFFFAGGFGTREEESVGDLAVQLRSHICTLFSATDQTLLPPSLFFDEHDGVEWEWQSRIEFFEKILRKSTAKTGSFQPFYVLRVDDPPSGSPRTGFLSRARDYFTLEDSDSIGILFGDAGLNHSMTRDWNSSGVRVLYGSAELLALFVHRLLVMRYTTIQTAYDNWGAK